MRISVCLSALSEAISTTAPSGMGGLVVPLEVKTTCQKPTWTGQIIHPAPCCWRHGGFRLDAKRNGFGQDNAGVVRGGVPVGCAALSACIERKDGSARNTARHTGNFE